MSRDNPRLSDPRRPALYIGDGEKSPSKFDRGSVEAAPDSLPQSTFSRAPGSPGLSRSGPREEETVRPQFYRGNIETSGASQTDLEPPVQRLQYYGAAKALNNNNNNNDQQEILSTGEIYQPLRQAVEARPELEAGGEEIQDMQDLRDHFQTQHGQTFHQARQAGHSSTFQRYQTNTNTGDSGGCSSFSRVKCFFLFFIILYFLTATLNSVTFYPVPL